MSRPESEALKGRLDLYRTLLRRDAGVPELGRLVDLLETELRGAGAEGRSPADERKAP